MSESGSRLPSIPRAIATAAFAEPPVGLLGVAQVDGELPEFGDRSGEVVGKTRLTAYRDCQLEDLTGFLSASGLPQAETQVQAHRGPSPVVVECIELTRRLIAQRQCSIGRVVIQPDLHLNEVRQRDAPAIAVVAQLATSVINHTEEPLDVSPGNALDRDQQLRHRRSRGLAGGFED